LVLDPRKALTPLEQRALYLVLRTDITTALKEGIAKEGLTIEQVAERSGMTTYHIENILDGDFDFTLLELAALAHAIGCEMGFDLKPFGTSHQRLAYLRRALDLVDPGGVARAHGPADNR